jgi:FHS family L-fucose permease-like MFS transporter
MTLIQGVGSIGTTVAPLFGAYFILSRLQESAAPSESVRFPYLGIAGLLLLIALIVFFLKLPHVKAVDEAGTKVFARSKGILSFRNLNFGMIGIFAYVGAEVSIGTFLTNYISDTLNIHEKSANNFVACYWGWYAAVPPFRIFPFKIYKTFSHIGIGSCACYYIHTGFH